MECGCPQNVTNEELQDAIQLFINSQSQLGGLDPGFKDLIRCLGSNQPLEATPYQERRKGF